MVDRAGFQVEGLNRLVRDLKGLGADVEDLKDTFASISARGAQIAASNAPRRTGALAASLRGNRATSKAVITAGRATVRYAGPINYGWPSRNIAASHFMQKTDEEMRPIALGMLEQGIEEAIQKRDLK